jgi:hypothetical protein
MPHRRSASMTESALREKERLAKGIDKLRQALSEQGLARREEELHRELAHLEKIRAQQ